MNEIIFFFVLVTVFSFLSKRYNLIPNFTGDKHQVFSRQKKVPLIGGLFVLVILLYLFYDNLILSLSLVSIFFLGILSDLKKLSSPKLRIIFQTFIALFLVYFLDLKIVSTRIDFFDLILRNNFIAILFSIFCLMILINGSNFIDGLNGLLLTYSLIILFLLMKFKLFENLNLSQNDIRFIIFSFTILLIFNFLNIFFLGDNGAYVIGLFFGYILIELYSLNISNISPYYIILLLWYPCFENLFSIIRKNKFNRSPINADNKHLHQLLYFYFERKFKTSILTNNLSSICINFYNFVILYIGSTQQSETMFQITLILINIFVYLLFYRILFSFRFKKEN